MKNILFFTALMIFAGCASHKIQTSKETFTVIKCQTVCQGDKCNQKCAGVQGEN